MAAPKDHVLINFYLPKETRDQFKIWCIQNNTTVSSVLVDYIDGLLEGHKHVPLRHAEVMKREPAKESVEDWFDKNMSDKSWEDTY